jgi:hypothetical protein
LVKESDMVDERTFECTNVLGAELCHGYGPSFGLQWAAVSNLSIALFLNVLLLCVAPVETTTTTFQYVRVPLLQPTNIAPGSGGVIISAPRSSTQGVVISANPTGVPRAQGNVAAEIL